jgi:elongator complex protein 2
VGHTDSVTAVRCLVGCSTGETIVSGSTDKSIRTWSTSSKSGKTRIIGHHDAAITAIAVLPGTNKILSAASDSVIKVWDISTKEPDTPLQTIRLKIIPLTIAVYQLDSTSIILALGGSHSSIQIYASDRSSSLVHAATLSGHSGWIRSLSFTHEAEHSSDIILASASQDKFVRLWRIHQGAELPSTKQVEDPSLGLIGKTVSTKAHRFTGGDLPYSITFEALLLGHEDWIYSCSWIRDSKLRLLTSSADNSLAIWEADSSTGIWLCTSRLGDISAEKGSTTATGSIGGFWNGLWSPDGQTVASLGRTGSWRVWTASDSGQWKPQVGCGGHTRSVTDLVWSRSGKYVLTTSLDQTTRLHAAWKHGDGSESWHEFARPQIHGYDLNCIDVISEETFISGADEKPLRVFQEPAIVADILYRLCDADKPASNFLPESANIPVLGLSNQAIQAVEGESVLAEETDETGTTGINRSIVSYDHAPLEDHLAKHLLWPETQKVYGHGYEISSVAVSHSGRLVSTACKASSIDHAVIRVYDTKEWREHCKPLAGHTLTVTDTKWSPDDKYLLSVSRDRNWSIFEAKDNDFVATTSKGHARMILACAWAPLEAGRIFATAGRDKAVKLWKLQDDKFELAETFAFDSPVTAVDILPELHDGNMIIASGLENGSVYFTIVSLNMQDTKTIAMGAACATKTITKLAWMQMNGGSGAKLALSSEDQALRIIDVKL